MTTPEEETPKEPNALPAQSRHYARDYSANDSPWITGLLLLGLGVMAMDKVVIPVSRWHEERKIMKQIRQIQEGASARAAAVRDNDNVTINLDEALKDMKLPTLPSFASTPGNLVVELQQQVDTLQQSATMHGITNITFVKDGKVLTNLNTQNLTLDGLMQAAEQVQLKQPAAGFQETVIHSRNPSTTSIER